MTVAELIAKLQTLGPETKVVLLDDQGYGLGVSLHLVRMGIIKPKSGKGLRDQDITDNPDAYPVGPQYPYHVTDRFDAVVVCAAGYGAHEREYEGWREV